MARSQQWAKLDIKEITCEISEMILCENIYLISRNAQYKDLNRITIENQQCRSTCIIETNYSLNVQNCTLQVSFFKLALSID